MADAPRVFLSYSHDSDEHADRVLALADALCDRGIDVILDRYVHPAPAEGWPRWMDQNLDEAKFVLMVCTETYRRRVKGLEEPGKGLRVRWEGSLINNRIYHDKPSGSRFIPILLPGSEPAHIPNPVQGHAYYQIATFDLTDPGFEALYRHLTDQPATPRPDLGALTILPPKPRPRPSPSPLSSILSLPLPKNRVLLEALYNETTEFLSFTDHYVDDFELLRRLLKDDGKGGIALRPVPGSEELLCRYAEREFTQQVALPYQSLKYIAVDPGVLVELYKKVATPSLPPGSSQIEAVRRQATQVSAIKTLAGYVRRFQSLVFDELASLTPDTIHQPCPAIGSPMTNVQGATSPASSGLDDRIRAALRPLMATEQSRQARLTRAFHAYPGLLDRVATGGETGVFLSHLLQTLRDYGEVEPGRPALRALLESVKDEVGAGDRAKIDQIIQSLGGHPGQGNPPASPGNPVPVSAQVTVMSRNIHPSITPTVGIVTALPHEFDAVRVVLAEFERVRIEGPGAGREYGIGAIRSPRGGTHRIVLARTIAMGTNSAAIRAEKMLSQFPSVRSVIMCGIAGAVPSPKKADEHVRLGDIVVSDRKGVVQYDYVKESGSYTEVRSAGHRPSAELIEAVGVLVEDELAGHRPWETHLREGLAARGGDRPDPSTDQLLGGNRRMIAHPDDPKRRGREDQPRIFLGPIASANTLLKSASRRNALRDQFGVRAVEMEGAGIVDATWEHNVGYLVVRGMCDYCDFKKNDLWQNYAAMAAAAYIRALLESIPGTANANP